MSLYLESFLLGVVLTLPLGPVTLEILRRGLQGNLFESLKTAIGAFGAELCYFSMVYFGLSGFSGNFFVRYGLGFLGVLFMFYLGFGNLMEVFSEGGQGKNKIIRGNAFLAGYAITFFNPINFFMWVGIIGGFFAKGASFFESSSILIGILLSLLVFVFLGGVGKKIISSRGMKYVSFIAGVFLIYYSIRLLLDIFSISMSFLGICCVCILEFIFFYGILFRLK